MMHWRAPAAANVGAALQLAPARAFGQGYGTSDDGAWALWVILAVIAVLYVLPTFVAFARNHPNRWVIAIINIVFGGTLLGWLVAMVWAMSAIHRSTTGNNGGESGLNIFANDTKAVRIEAAETSSPVGQIERLKQLLDDGALDAGEYARFKGQILSQMTPH